MPSPSSTRDGIILYHSYQSEVTPSHHSYQSEVILLMALAMMYYLTDVHSAFLLIIIHNKTEVQSYVKDVVGKMIEFLYFCRFLQLIESKTNIETDSKILKLKNVTKTNMRLFRYCAYKVFTSSSGKSYWAAEVTAYVRGSTIPYKSFHLQNI